MTPMKLLIETAAIVFLFGANLANAGPRACEQEGTWACVEQDAMQADNALNVAYKETMARLDASGKIKLRTEQRAWIKERDKECSANAINPGQLRGCELDLTITRTAEIRRY